jgi:hypothetical protein
MSALSPKADMPLRRRTCTYDYFTLVFLLVSRDFAAKKDKHFNLLPDNCGSAPGTIPLALGAGGSGKREKPSIDGPKRSQNRV